MKARQDALPDLSCQGYPERLCAEDQFLGQSQQGGIDCNGQLHRQLWRDDRSYNHCAVQEKLEAAAVRILQSTACS